jgi:hypothetical protein
VFLSRESFFLGRRHDLAVTHQGRGTVVIKCRNAEYVHTIAFPVSGNQRWLVLLNTYDALFSAAALSSITLAYSSSYFLMMAR